jgi:hypothetical protein
LKTEQLVAALVADRAGGARSSTRGLALGLLAGGVISLGLFLAALGPRHDLAAALATWRFDLKIAVLLLALFLAFRLCRALLQPVPVSHPGRYLLPLLAVAVVAVAIELVDVPMTAWPTRLVGRNSMICLSALPALSLAPLVAVLVMARSAAPASPALAGGAAGVLAAACGATLYAFHCFDDSPLFVVTWYSLATLIVVTAGWLAGRKLLRW